MREEIQKGPLTFKSGCGDSFFHAWALGCRSKRRDGTDYRGDSHKTLLFVSNHAAIKTKFVWLKGNFYVEKKYIIKGKGTTKS